MALLVDGYNVVFAEAGAPVRKEAGEIERLRTGLLERLEQYRTLGREEITVVFDGGVGGAHLARHQWFGGTEVIFSEPSSDADAEIKQIVRESTHARDLRVVTDDRELAQYVRRFHATVSGTADLLAKMERAEEQAEKRAEDADPACKFTGPGPNEVKDWMEIFGELDEEDPDDE
jgi:predicted RNA-binding protein with PIN domain